MSGRYQTSLPVFLLEDLPEVCYDDQEFSKSYQRHYFHLQHKRKLIHYLPLRMKKESKGKLKSFGVVNFGP